MASPASINKHPIHPMFIVFPVGLWIFSLIADLIFVGGKGAPIWNDVAFYTMAGGIIGALLAAVPGLIDFLSIRDAKTRQIGVYHMTINLVVVALFAFNLWLRTSYPAGARLPILLSVIGVILLGISGWLGGELVFKHGVGVDT